MRVRIPFPKSVAFSILIPVRISDINYGGHVGNDSILSILHEARLAYLKQHQFTEMNCSGHGLIMADSAIQYKAESFHGDILKVEVAVENITSIAFDLYYKITTPRENQTVTIALAKTGMIGFDYSARKICNLSEPLIALLHSKSIS